MTGPLLQAEGLSRHFTARGMFRPRRPIKAVSDVSLTLDRGETLGLVGESGSGKSTIGRLLLGLIPPSTGRILFDGEDVARSRGAARKKLRQRMQLVFQDPYSSLDPRRRIGAQIADGLAIHELVTDPTARREEVQSLLEQVGLNAAHAGRFPHEFSGGQRQRIGLARALATRPDILIADEPVSALDVSVQAQILHLMSDLRARSGLGLLFISHDLHVVRSLCDRVAVLYFGRIVEEGPVAAVMENPQHPYTQMLLASSPRMDGSRRHVPPAPAESVSHTDIQPGGCAFRARCPCAIAACASSEPDLQTVTPGHRVACFRV